MWSPMKSCPRRSGTLISRILPGQKGIRVLHHRSRVPLRGGSRLNSRHRSRSGRPCRSQVIAQRAMLEQMGAQCCVVDLSRHLTPMGPGRELADVVAASGVKLSGERLSRSPPEPTGEPQPMIRCNERPISEGFRPNRRCRCLGLASRYQPDLSSAREPRQSKGQQSRLETPPRPQKCAPQPS